MKSIKRSLKGVFSVSQLIGAVIVAVVLGALIGVVTDNTIGLTNNASLTNFTGPANVLIDLVPLFLVIALVVSYVADL